jgi:hypothetical protein
VAENQRPGVRISLGEIQQPLEESGMAGLLSLQFLEENLALLKGLLPLLDCARNRSNLSPHLLLSGLKPLLVQQVEMNLRRKIHCRSRSESSDGPF